MNCYFLQRSRSSCYLILAVVPRQRSDVFRDGPDVLAKGLTMQTPNLYKLHLFVGGGMIIVNGDATNNYLNY